MTQHLAGSKVRVDWQRFAWRADGPDTNARTSAPGNRILGQRQRQQSVEVLTTNEAAAF